eukprot:UN14575
MILFGIIHSERTLICFISYYLKSICIGSGLNIICSNF